MNLQRSHRIIMIHDVHRENKQCHNVIIVIRVHQQFLLDFPLLENYHEQRNMQIVVCAIKRSSNIHQNSKLWFDAVRSACSVDNWLSSLLGASLRFALARFWVGKWAGGSDWQLLPAWKCDQHTGSIDDTNMRIDVLIIVKPTGPPCFIALRRGGRLEWCNTKGITPDWILYWVWCNRRCIVRNHIDNVAWVFFPCVLVLTHPLIRISAADNMPRINTRTFRANADRSTSFVRSGNATMVIIITSHICNNVAGCSRPYKCAQLLCECNVVRKCCAENIEFLLIAVFLPRNTIAQFRRLRQNHIDINGQTFLPPNEQ